jgi:hypothetical protein
MVRGLANTAGAAIVAARAGTPFATVVVFGGVRTHT